MVRSFSYAAYAALLAFTVHAADGYSALEPWAEAWQRWIVAAFLAAYRNAMMTFSETQASQAEPLPLVPEAEEAFNTMLRVLTLEKACYEVEYELNQRPDWVRIPLTGVLNLANPLQS